MYGNVLKDSSILTLAWPLFANERKFAFLLQNLSVDRSKMIWNLLIIQVTQAVYWTN